MPMQWEYLVEAVESDEFYSRHQLAENLNERAAEGWELVGIVDLWVEGAGKWPHLIYKKLSGAVEG